MLTVASNKQVIYISSLQATNKKILSPLKTIKKILSPPVTKLSDPNNKELYPLHQVYPNNRSGKGADPFLWLFPNPELLLDQYVPYVLQLYSEQSDKIKNDQEIMQFFNNDYSEININ
jgi:hypothetical protein